MRNFQKKAIIAVMASSLLLPFDGAIAASLANVESTQITAFPGTIRVTSDGTVQIDIEHADDYEDAVFSLLVLNERGKQEKRLIIEEDDEEIDLKGMNLDEGEYEIVLEMKLNGETVRSASADWTIKKEYDQDEPPGSIEVEDEGTIWVNVEQNRSDRGEGSFYVVVISDRSDKVVRRIPIAPQDIRFAASSLQLPPGTYEVYLEWAKDKEVLRSNQETWEIEEQAPISLPAGEDFPGSLSVAKDGSITCTLDREHIPATALSYLVVLDLNKKEVKRIKLDPLRPEVSKRDLVLRTGGYQLVLELVDPVSAQASQSLPTFYPVNQSNSPVVFLNGQLQSYPQAPVLIKGNTFVPLRSIFEALGAEVTWDSASKSVKAIKGGTVVEITIGSSVAYVNGQKLTLEAPPQLYQGKTTMVPLRFVSEALGAKVDWEPYSKAVTIRQ